MSVASPIAGDQPVQPGHFDGPAELPRIYIQSRLTDTPALGKVCLVKQDDNLQDAIDSAKCGDTLKLQAAATFRGLFRLPAKPCDDSHWIILRTSAPDDTLPPEDPYYALLRRNSFFAGPSRFPLCRGAQCSGQNRVRPPS
jgi:hypothetical protein